MVNRRRLYLSQLLAFASFAMLTGVQWLHPPSLHLHEHSHVAAESCTAESTGHSHGHQHACGHNHAEKTQPVVATELSQPSQGHEHLCPLCEHLAKPLASATLTPLLILPDSIEIVGESVAPSYLSPERLHCLARGPPLSA